MQLGNDYNAWHRHFQPEETGRDHGVRCLPRSEDTASDWENAVRSAARKTIEDYSLSFRKTEGVLAGQFEQAKALYDRYRQAHEEKCIELCRQIVIPLAMKPAIGVTVFLFVAASALNTILAGMFLEPVVSTVGVLCTLD